MDWPTGQLVNRQSRALLSVLLFGVIALVGWRSWSNTPERNDSAGEIVISEKATRGGTLVSSLRSEPRTFNRVLDQAFPVDLFNILTSSKLVRVNRATRAVEPALVEKWTTSPDNLTYHADAARRRHLVRRHAVHVRRRAVYLPGDLRPEGRERARQRPACERAAAEGDRAGRQDRGGDAARHLRSRHCDSRQRPRPAETQAAGRARRRQVRAGPRRGHAAGGPRRRSVRSCCAATRPDSGWCSIATRATGRKTPPAFSSRTPTRWCSKWCPIRTRSWCACSPGRSTCCSSRFAPKTWPRCGR